MEKIKSLIIFWTCWKEHEVCYLNNLQLKRRSSFQCKHRMHEKYWRWKIIIIIQVLIYHIIRPECTCSTERHWPKNCTPSTVTVLQIGFNISLATGSYYIKWWKTHWKIANPFVRLILLGRANGVVEFFSDGIKCTREWEIYIRVLCWQKFIHASRQSHY